MSNSPLSVTCCFLFFNCTTTGMNVTAAGSTAENTVADMIVIMTRTAGVAGHTDTFPAETTQTGISNNSKTGNRRYPGIKPAQIGLTEVTETGIRKGKGIMMRQNISKAGVKAEENMINPGLVTAGRGDLVSSR